MRPQENAYLNQTLHGDSRWWIWGIVFWFTVLGWLMAQLLVTSPVGPLLSAADPELSKQMNEMSLAALTGENSVPLAIFGGAFGLSTLLGLLFWVINRVTKKTAQKIFGVLCGIMVVISLGSLAKFFTIARSKACIQQHPKFAGAGDSKPSSSHGLS